MRILHITGSVRPQSYGLGQVTLNLARAQARQGQDVTIWCLDATEERRCAAESVGLAPEAIRGFGRIGAEILGWSPGLLRAAWEEAGSFDIAHQHGIWTGVSHATRVVARRHGVPTVVAPHGSLERSVLKKSRWKKALATLAYESANLKGAACLHATAPAEVGDFRGYGLRNPIALVTSGVPEGWLRSEGDAARFRSSHQLPADRRILLFMSRIAPKKGLPMLLEAMREPLRCHPEWLLVIVGGDEDGHKVRVEARVDELGLRDSVRFLGPIFGPGKRDAFAAAEIFVLPSHSEGFPMVVLDSLGAGVPAIVTRASAWEDLVLHGCGWWPETTRGGLASALMDAMGCSPEELARMGASGRALLESKYDWNAIATRTLELYDWLRRGGAAPRFVSQVLNPDERF